MKRTLVASAIAMAALLLFVLPAYGTTSKQPPVFSPKKGGIYIGTIKSTFDLAITMKVSRSGKSARITWLCGTGRAPTVAPNVPIDRATGTFKASNNLWKLSGRFVSATQARVALNDIGCGGSKGSTKLTLK
jgi:hypothetical protein